MAPNAINRTYDFYLNNMKVQLKLFIFSLILLQLMPTTFALPSFNSDIAEKEAANARCAKYSPEGCAVATNRNLQVGETIFDCTYDGTTYNRCIAGNFRLTAAGEERKPQMEFQNYMRQINFIFWLVPQSNLIFRW